MKSDQLFFTFRLPFVGICLCTAVLCSGCWPWLLFISMFFQRIYCRSVGYLGILVLFPDIISVKVWQSDRGPHIWCTCLRLTQWLCPGPEASVCHTSGLFWPSVLSLLFFGLILFFVFFLDLLSSFDDDDDDDYLVCFSYSWWGISS